MKGWAVLLLRTVGGILIGAGLLGIGVCVYGVIRVVGQPDRSWIFWGPVFLLGGLLLVQGGVVLLLYGRVLGRDGEAR